jgi:hypothetical protein
MKSRPDASRICVQNPEQEVKAMNQEFNIKGLSEKIALMKQSAIELKDMGAFFPALDRNIARILASIKMLEINITDAADLDCRNG